jgi:hypothetical protein
MSKLYVGYTDKMAESAMNQSRMPPTRETLTCVAAVATELQAVASRAGMDISALLLGQAAEEARMYLCRMGPKCR